MIVVDTSVWVNAFREQKSPEGRHLSELLDRDAVAIAIPIRIELLSGARRSEQPRLSRLFPPSQPFIRMTQPGVGLKAGSGQSRTQATGLASGIY